MAEVYGSRHITIEVGVCERAEAENDFTKLYEDRLHLYVEEMMARFFGGTVGVV